MHMRLLKRFTSEYGLLCVGLALLLALPGFAVDLPGLDSDDYVAGEVVVRAHPHGRAKLHSLGRPAWAGEPEKVAKLRRMGCRSARPAFGVAASGADMSDVFVVELDPGIDVLDAMVSLLADPDVMYAEPNLLYRAQVRLPEEAFLPRDPFVTRNGLDWSQGAWGQSFSDLWGLEVSRVIEAWNEFDLDGSGALEPGEPLPGEGVIVAVVDSGVDITHPDLASAIWNNPLEVAGNGVDDDGNGFIDDVVGFDFISFDADPSDRFGHGTHVAGTIAASLDDFGVVGVAPGARIMVLKGLSDVGSGTSVGLALAVRYAVDNGAHIISNSWGGTRANQIIKDAFAYARDHGVISVAAAGNVANNVEGTVPASLPGVVAVAALDVDSLPATFTNVGSRIDISAPGVQVLSVSANASDNFIAESVPERIIEDDFIYLNGTSMACPHVSGALAVLLSRFPGEAPDDLVGRLVAGSAPLVVPGFEGALGFGRLDVAGAMEALPRPLLQRVGNPLPSLVPGETVEVVVTLVNRWVQVDDVVAELVSSDPGVRLLQSSASFASLPNGVEASNASQPFLVGADAAMPFGTRVDFELRLSGSGGFFSVLPLELGAAFYQDIGAESGLPLEDSIIPWRVTLVDVDGDTLPDVHWVGTERNLLFRNIDGTHFEDVTLSAGVARPTAGVSQGVFMDLEGDGDQDMLLANGGRGIGSSLFLNRGDGTFVDQTSESPVRHVRGFGTVATDANLDGNVDLLGLGFTWFVEESEHPQASFLLTGDGSGALVDATANSCLPTNVALTIGQVLAFDYDSDGDSDIAMISRGLSLQLFRRDPGGVFANVTREVGLGRSFRKEVACRVAQRLREGFCQPNAGSGIAAGDYDGDGDIDLYATGRDLSNGAGGALYRNVKGRRFVDVTASTGDLATALPGVHWGTAFFDFDNDGDLDLHISNDSFGAGSENALYRNRGGGTFELINDEAFPAHPIGLGPQSAASAIGDIDGDGTLDLYSPASTFLTAARGLLLRNIGARGQHWLKVRLVGVASTPQAWGARVEVVRGRDLMVREVQTGPVSSQSLHFGLGDAAKVGVTVRWPSGLIQRLGKVQADRELVVEEPVHCMDAGRGRSRRRAGCRGVLFNPPDERPARVRVPRWAREFLPEEGPVCQAFVDSLVLQRRVCQRLAVECRRRAARLPGPLRGNLKCALPDVSTFGCGISPHAELLDECDCFDFPQA